MSDTVLALYRRRITERHFEPDPAQEMLARRFDRLSIELSNRRLGSKSSALGWLFARQKPESPKGVYVWGGVGRGKTMMMDLFAEVAPPPKRRVHFHAFMAEVHERLATHRRRDRQEGEGGDAIGAVADEVAAEAALLLFDEFTVTDIADAMILGRLFEALFGRGLTIVATSNLEPRRLYEGGLNRALFLPFIAILEARMDVVHLAAAKDYRFDQLADESVLVPAGAEGSAHLARLFRRLTGLDQGSPRTLRLLGREIFVPEAAEGIARLDFADLCRRPLGAPDFLALSREFHTLLVDGVPVLAPDAPDVARRFITLIDTLYDRGTTLILAAEAEPTELGAALRGREGHDFARTASRLADMRSAAYLARNLKGRAGTPNDERPGA